MASIEKKFTLSVPSSTENLVLVREFISNIGGQAGFDELDVNKLQLAVDEACANVIEHAYSYDNSKEVLIRATFDTEKLKIDIVDTGPAFDPTTGAIKDIKQLIREKRSGGLGLRLMKTLVDELHYDNESDQKNALHMIKRLPPKK